MTIAFKKATKQQARLRMALIGPAGSGKTYTALSVAACLGARVAVIDTERGSASKYSDKFSFDVLELETFAPLTYVEAIKAAELNQYDVLVIDSLSHAWSGKDGALEQVDKAAARSQSKNSFAAWRDVTPMHNALVDTILNCRCHVITTMRAKTEYVIEQDERGRNTPRKVGLAPVQRDGVEYEFDVIGDLTTDNTLIIGKTRCSALTGQTFKKPGEDFATILRDWLRDGVEPDPRVELIEELKDLAKRYANVKTQGDWRNFIKLGLGLESYYEGCLLHASLEQLQTIQNHLRDLKAASEQ